MIIYCSTVSVTRRMLKLCENGSNIDYLYETSSVLRKATETKILALTLKTATEPKFGFHTSLILMKYSFQIYNTWTSTSYHMLFTHKI